MPERLRDPSLFAVRFADVVSRDRVFRRQLARLLLLRHSHIDLVDVAEKTAVRQPRTDVAGVAVEKRLVRLADLAEPVAHLQIERRGIDADLLRGQLRIAANPFINLVVNLVVELKQFAELALNHRTGRVRRLGLPGRRLAKREQQRCKKNVPNG